MNDRDCESCKKFSRNDPHESEGYCDAKRTWVDPQEGEDCKMHEFTLHSANKYKDGSPIMSEPDTTSSYPLPKSNQLDSEFCEFGTCPYYDKFCGHTLHDKHGCAYLPHTPEADLKYLEQTFTEFAKTQDDLIEEYDATLKTHGDTLEQHKERITNNEGNIDAISYDVEDLQRKVYEIYQFLNSVAPDFFFKLSEEIKKNAHNGSNFCGNCTHAKSKDGICACELSGEIVDPVSASCSLFDSSYASNFCGNCIHAEMKDGICACELSGEIVDPDSASCSLFDPSYASNPEWFENMKKTMTTPAEPTVGCKDCNCAKDGMCTKYNCSLGAICATPECFEPPF